jgi:purine-binding chemotaxis protein CheW
MRAMTEISPAIAGDKPSDYVTVRLGEQRFGIPILSVHDILNEQRMTKVALAAGEVSGVMNIRGRIVTAIDLRRLMGLEDRAQGQTSMNVVVHFRGEPYALVVDSVGEVRSLGAAGYERNPSNMDAGWAALSQGIYRLDEGLLVILDVERVIGGLMSEKAA